MAMRRWVGDERRVVAVLFRWAVRVDGGRYRRRALLLLIGQIADEVRFQLFLMARPTAAKLMRRKHFIVDVIGIGTSSRRRVITHSTGRCRWLSLAVTVDRLRRAAGLMAGQMILLQLDLNARRAAINDRAA